MKTRIIGKTIFALLLSLATVCVAQGTDQHKSKVLTYEEYAAGFKDSANRPIDYDDKSVRRNFEYLKVKYNPEVGLVKILAENLEVDDSTLFAIINVYDSDSMWLGRSDTLELNYSYKNQFFLGDTLVKFAKFIDVVIKRKEDKSFYFFDRSYSSCKYPYDTLFKVSYSLLQPKYWEFLSYETCDITFIEKQLGVDPFSCYWIWTKDNEVKLVPYENCDDKTKYFGLDSTSNECILRTICEEGEIYDSVNNSCYLIFPANSHLNRYGEWECDLGYVMIDGSCEAKAECDSSQGYDASENTCLVKPFGLTSL